MKIVLWSTLFYPNIGGLEKMVHSLALGLQKKGHEILVIADERKRRKLSIDGIVVYTFEFTNSLFNYQLLKTHDVIQSVHELLSAFLPDVINIHGWLETYAFYQTRILKKHNTPLCLTLHGLLEQKHYHTPNCLQLWNRAQAVNTVSQAVAPPMLHPFLQTIYNGLPLSKAPLCPLKKNKLLMIGRLSEEKCFSVAFYALELLLPKYPDLQLTLVGDGPEYPMLFALKESLNLPIEMTGLILPNRIESFIDQSTLVIIPSYYESFCLVALEAALRARPVVASRVLGLKEVVEDQKTGLLVEPRNPSQLAAAIDTLLSSPERMNEMGQAAFKRASQQFTLENTLNQYLKMYEQASRICHHSCA